MNRFEPIWTDLAPFCLKSAHKQTSQVHFEHIHWPIGNVLWTFLTVLYCDVIGHRRKVSRLYRIVVQQCRIVRVQCQYCTWLRAGYLLLQPLFLYMATMFYDFRTKSCDNNTNSLYIATMYKEFVAIYTAVGPMYIYISAMFYTLWAFMPKLTSPLGARDI